MKKLPSLSPSEGRGFPRTLTPFVPQSVPPGPVLRLEATATIEAIQDLKAGSRLE